MTFEDEIELVLLRFRDGYYQGTSRREEDLAVAAIIDLFEPKQPKP